MLAHLAGVGRQKGLRFAAMRYLVACNWDPGLLDRIDCPEVSSLFGGLPDSVISSGRPSSQIRPVPRTQVKQYIARVHEKKWSFDYNVNASCLGNHEVSQKGFGLVMKYLEGLVDLGIDALTISNTNLIGMVKKNFPKIRGEPVDLSEGDRGGAGPTVRGHGRGPHHVVRAREP